MPKSKQADQHLLLRGSSWSYYRRVPNDVRKHVGKTYIFKALKTRSIEAARRARDGLKEADDLWWRVLRIADEHDWPLDHEAARKKHASMVAHALALGFDYQSMSALARPEKLDTVVDRLLAIGNTTGASGEPDERDAEALLGATKEPAVLISDALKMYTDEIKAADLMTKSPNQKRLWENTKRRSVGYFIQVVGDVPIDSISREQAIKFKNYWIERMDPDHHENAVSWNTANRHIGDVRALYNEYFKYIGKEDRKNPFRGLSFKDQGLKAVPAFEDKWVREKFLVRGAMSAAKWEIQIVPYVIMETGLRPSEVLNLRPQDIILDADVPHISVQPVTKGPNRREIKAKDSVRKVPLVGAALEAMKRAPDGFPGYHDRGSSFSAACNKAMKARGLCPTDDHVLYSLRHAFEKRMQEANIDFALRCLLMGHKVDRPKYGDGGSLAYRRDELLKIVHPIPDDLFDSLDKEGQRGLQR